MLLPTKLSSTGYSATPSNFQWVSVCCHVNR